VLKGLVGGANAAIQDGLHRGLSAGVNVHFGLCPHGQFDPSGRFWQAVLNDAFMVNP
jgi:hypothetical protein